MANVSDVTLKTYFNTGDIPTEAQFIDLIDSKANLTGIATLTHKTIDASSNTLQNLPAELIVALSDETTDLTTGLAQATFRMPYAMTLTDLRINVATAPVGSLIYVNASTTGLAILSTSATIDASEKTSVTAATPPVISTSLLQDDDEITFDLTGVGSSTAGAGLKACLIGTRA